MLSPSMPIHTAERISRAHLLLQHHAGEQYAAWTPAERAIAAHGVLIGLRAMRDLATDMIGEASRAAGRGDQHEAGRRLEAARSVYSAVDRLADDGAGALTDDLLRRPMPIGS